MFAIIDIETTGLKATTERITEIAIYIYDGTQVVERFVSLVNPERTIPYQITKITGITNQLVANAPKFHKIADKIIQITENKTFVAHNAQFDYRFVKEEFKRLGYNYQRKSLCTVRLTKKLIPNLPSYSLGNICESLGISIMNRHRAAGDTEATVKLFEQLLEIDKAKKPLFADLESQKNGLHHNFKEEIIENLPEKEGVFYFYNQYKQLIYCEKSQDIKKQVQLHFANTSTPKAIEMKSKIVDIDYELTGNELISLLLEADEIETHNPIYNRNSVQNGHQNGGNPDYKNQNFLLLDKGRSDDEKSIVQVSNGKYIGFGYIDTDMITNDLELLFDCIKPRKNNEKIEIILKNHIKNNETEQIIT